MKIKAIQFENYHQNLHGILPGTYNNFSDTICLVGKNGSGKTRIMKLLVKELQNNSIYHFLNNDMQTNISLPIDLIFLQKEVELLKPLKGEFYKNGEDSNIGISKIYEILDKQNSPINLTPQIESIKRELRAETNSKIVQINYSSFKDLKLNTTLHSQSTQNGPLAVPKSLQRLREQIQGAKVKPNTNLHFTTKSLSDAISSVYTFGIQYIEKLAKILAYEQLKNFSKPELIKNSENYRQYLRLNELINQLLGKSLEYKIDEDDITIEEKIGGIDGKWFVNDRPFNYPDLSDGEKVLFSFALLLFIHEENTNVPIDESIIVIDEPETHLHPHFQVLLIKRLKNIIKGKGQLIIATHSIHIISCLEPEEIYLVENGQLFPPSSKNVSKIVDSLIGLGDDFEKFKEFCFEEFDFGFRSFLGQCFIRPEIIQSAKDGDPQIELFKRSIQGVSNINVLDFGAGAGRLGKELLREIKNGKINYFTYDKISIFNDQLKNLGTKQSYSDINSIPNSLFDYVVLCNVLHEISLEDIVIELNTIKRVLKASGFLIILEDKLLNKGEKAHEDGFLLFTEMELPMLFNTSNEIGILQVEEPRYTDRILCAVISKQIMGDINEARLKDSLSELKKNSYQKFKNVRLSSNQNFKSLYEKGRISALYSQQFMNASFALDKIEGNAMSSKMEIEANYPGNWSKFLKKNINPDIGVKNNAPKGEYKVIIRFIIDANGNVTDLVPETSFGYGMEEEVIRVLELSPKWNPASLDSIPVNAYRRQPVTFIVQED